MRRIVKMRALCGVFLLYWSGTGLLAQYPSASYRTSLTPMLGEYKADEVPHYNPALLGVAADTLRDDLTRDFHIKSLIANVSYNLFSFVFTPNPPGFEEALGERANDLSQGLSVMFTDLDSRARIYQDALSAYGNDLAFNVVPALAGVATGSVPNGLSKADVEANVSYTTYKNRLEGDGVTLLSNIGRVVGEIAAKYLSEVPLFDSEAYVTLFDLEFLLDKQVSLGFGVNIRTHIETAGDLSDLNVDVSRLDLPQLSLAGITLPTDADWAASVPLATQDLQFHLAIATANYIRNLESSLNASELGKLVIQSLFEQSFINLYQVVEPNVRISFGFPLNSWIYVGSRVQAQLLWGVDNLTISTDSLDLNQPVKFAEFIYDPRNYQLGIHLGWDASIVLQLADWFSFSLVVTDILGIAPSSSNAAIGYWGDPYYPIDIHFGTLFQVPLGADLTLGFGVDFYNLISLLTGQPQRFSSIVDSEVFDHLRSKLSLNYRNQFQVVLNYWARSFGVGLQFDFLTFHPSIGVEFGWDLRDIRINLNILHLTN